MALDQTIVSGDSAPSLTWVLPLDVSGSVFYLSVVSPGSEDIWSAPTRPYGGLTGLSGADVNLDLSSAAGDLAVDVQARSVTWSPSPEQLQVLGPTNFYTLTRSVPGGSSSPVASGRVYVSPCGTSSPGQVTVQSLGPQGPPGVAGPAGPPGPPTDYGDVRYGEVMGTTTRAMAANTPTQFVVRTPQLVTDNLKPPFAGFQFIDSTGLLHCREAGDSYLLSVRLTVTPQTIGGWFSLGVFVAGNVSGLAGPTSSRQILLSGPAGTDFRFDELYQVFPSSGFAANGAVLMMQSSVPVVLSQDVLFVTPQVAAP